MDLRHVLFQNFMSVVTISRNIKDRARSIVAVDDAMITLQQTMHT